MFSGIVKTKTIPTILNGDRVLEAVTEYVVRGVVHFEKNASKKYIIEI